MKQNIYKEASGDMQKVRLALEKKNDTKRYNTYYEGTHSLV